MSIAVVGVGGIGGVVAATLRAAGHDVIACARRPFARLALLRPEGDVEVDLCVHCDPAGVWAADWVLLCTKAHQSSSAAPWLARLCGPATRVAVLQNGIGQRERVAPLVGSAHVVPTIVYYNGERLADDRVRMRHADVVDLAVGDDADGRAFAALFAGTPLAVRVTGDLPTLAWRKLLLNLAANPITALTGRRQEVLRGDAMRALCSAVFDEAVAVARAEGARFGPTESVDALARLMSYPADAGTSMYFDRLAGRRSEVDELTGPLVAAGRRHGIPTPLNAALLALMRAIDDAQPAG
ncbi:MAG TPA: 2-dehydropantoate 2-reductase [Candidatus Sulfotelmatobacter sp.]|nr:2-dehydropantoate 2-reductase [Candidatus Sulfotelmatobacter sp.]